MSNHKIVADKIHEFDGEKYKLIAYCIMPNHVHLLIDTFNFSFNSGGSENKSSTKYYYLTDILRLIKGNTARYCNQILNRSGKFWQSESYDHYVRNQNELGRIIEYILDNPVKANLCNERSDWKWSYSYCSSSFSPSFQNNSA